MAKIINTKFWMYEDSRDTVPVPRWVQALGVGVFVVGLFLAAWVNTPVKEEATPDCHPSDYACIEDWYRGPHER